METQRLNIFLDPEVVRVAKIRAIKERVTLSKYIEGLIIKANK